MTSHSVSVQTLLVGKTLNLRLRTFNKNGRWVSLSFTLINGTLGTLVRGADEELILMDVSFIDPGRQQHVALQVGALPIIRGREWHIPRACHGNRLSRLFREAVIVSGVYH